jgi:hypothetical protein
MSIYCEGAAAAEITFSLTGGREGKIISYNPPVIISSLQNGTCKLFLSDHGGIKTYFNGVISSRIFANYPAKNYLTIIEETIPPRIIPPEFNMGNLPGEHYCAFYLVFFSTFTPQVNWREQNPLILRKIIDGVFDWFPYGSGNFFGFYAPLFGYNYDDVPETGNLFVIQDMKEVLYSFSYTEPPTYQVKCLSCPANLCAVKGRNGKIECLDCKRMLNGLGRVSNNLDKML